MEVKRFSNLNGLTRSVHRGVRIIASGLAFFLLLPLSVPLEAQEDRGEDLSPEAKPHLFQGDLRGLPRARLEVSTDLSRSLRGPESQGRQNDTAVLDPGQKDPLLDLEIRGSSRQANLESGLDLEGLGYAGMTPPSTIGDVGRDYYIQMIDGARGSLFAVYDKSTGNMTAGPLSLHSLWTSGGACASGWGSPMVVFDSLADRWLLAEIGVGNHLCVYISRSSDPVAGGWYAYDFEVPAFPRYARYGVWPEAFVVATSEIEPTVYALDRAAMMAGLPASYQRFVIERLSGFGFQALAPGDVDGTTEPPSGSRPVLVRQVDGNAHGGGDRLQLFELEVSWTNPSASRLIGPLEIATAAFDSALCGYFTRSCIPQPDGAPGLDPLREVVMWGLRYRNTGDHETLVGSFSVDVDGSDHAGIRWFELRRSGGGWTLFQEGTLSPDSLHRWVGSIALDQSGNLLLGYSVSGETLYPSIRYTGREASDPPGIMTEPESELRAGTQAQIAGHSPELWGGYSAMTVDPVDDCTFWYTNQYAAGGQWATAIGRFQFPDCGAPASDDLFSDGFESGDLSAWTGSAS